MHGGIGLATGLFTGSVSGGAVASSLTFVGAEGLGRLLTSPQTAQIMVSLAGGEPLWVTEQYAGRMIAQVLKGATVEFIGQDGARTPAQVK